LYYAVRDAFIDQGLVFFGGYASFLYSTYMPAKQRKMFHKTPDFDVLSEEPEKSAIMLKERLEDFDYTGIQIIKHDGIGELIAPHVEVKVKINKIHETVAFIYKPLACHSYNIVKKGNKSVRVATIDTMLSFYFAFFYSGRDYYDDDRIVCMAQYLFDVQQKNRLQQKGVLKRFSIDCYGKQETLEEMRNIKSEKYKELKSERGSKEYESWFLRYVPFEQHTYNKSQSHSNKKTKDNKKHSSRASTTKKRNKKTKKNANGKGIFGLF